MINTEFYALIGKIVACLCTLVPLIFISIFLIKSTIEGAAKIFPSLWIIIDYIKNRSIFMEWMELKKQSKNLKPGTIVELEISQFSLPHDDKMVQWQTEKLEETREWRVGYFDSLNKCFEEHLTGDSDYVFNVTRWRYI